MDTIRMSEIPLESPSTLICRSKGLLCDSKLKVTVCCSKPAVIWSVPTLALEAGCTLPGSESTTAVKLPEIFLPDDLRSLFKGASG
jgi:hypothetical protein